MKIRDFLIITLTLTLTSHFIITHKERNKKILKICFDTPWKNLHPGTQNTLIGGLIISQQFESLVKIDSNGNIVPSLAKNWIISDDFKSITFTLDESKKFNNGNPITSSDVFKSWITSFNMSTKTPNNGLKDVLFNIIGFEQGKRPEEITGFEKIDDLKFKLKFKKPFRMAIYHLRGARFAIYSEDKGQINGSGPFIFNIHDQKDTLILKNKITNTNLEISFIQGLNHEELIKNNICDISYAPAGSDIRFSTPNISTITSEDAVHLIFILNTKQGIFSDINARKAFQFLIHNNLSTGNLFTSDTSTGKSDPQIYNLFSQGRLSNEETDQIINEGKYYVKEFYEKAKNNKLKIFVNKKGYLENAFKAINIVESINEIYSDPKKVTSSIYSGNFEQDFTGGFLSVLSYDPDGIYHALGRHGAILNPYMANEKIFDLLEEGREITDRNKIDEHYKNVSRTFLQEVPFIHLGFSKNVLLYNNKKVKIDKDSFRNSLDFSSFEQI